VEVRGVRRTARFAVPTRNELSKRGGGQRLALRFVLAEHSVPSLILPDYSRMMVGV